MMHSLEVLVPAVKNGDWQIIKDQLLNQAVWAHETKAVEELLELGANPRNRLVSIKADDDAEEEYWDPLLYAKASGSKKMVDLLEKY